MKKFDRTGLILFMIAVFIFGGAVGFLIGHNQGMEDLKTEIIEWMEENRGEVFRIKE